MSEFIIKEIQLFFRAAISGVIFVIIYDLQRILQNIIPHSRVAIRIEEGLYWTAVGIFIFYDLYRSNQGIFRGFILVGILMGGYLYERLIGHRLFRLFYSYGKMLRNVLVKLTKPGDIFIKRLINFYNSCKIFIRKIRNSCKFQNKRAKDRGNR